ncbi:MAG: arginase family protein [Planctomycetes bacterium]|nr:arginase family protein [Planctomycetota bacterium]
MANKTTAVFFPFDQFGGGGAAAGARLLADAFRELLDDNRREKVATRARCYAGKVRLHEAAFDDLDALQTWRETGQELVRQALARGDFLIWAAGNHLGVLPVYDELAGRDMLVVQLDAHLDVYNLSDCTKELSHGNFVRHCERLPPLINVGHRELLLRTEYVAKFYRQTFSAAELTIHPDKTLAAIGDACVQPGRVLVDLDCDVLDPAFFPAVSEAVPFGLTPQMLLRVLAAIGMDRLAGLAISEFQPARDAADRCLETLMWLLEHVLLAVYER